MSMTTKLRCLVCRPRPITISSCRLVSDELSSHHSRGLVLVDNRWLTAFCCPSTPLRISLPTLADVVCRYSMIDTNRELDKVPVSMTPSLC